MQKSEPLEIIVVAVKSGRKCRHGHKNGDTFILENNDCKGLCARNKKFFLKMQDEIIKNGAFICPDKAVTFKIRFPD